MKLWLLEAIEGVDYDCAAGFVVRAETHIEARKLASEDAGEEGATYWLDAARSTCRRLKEDGRPGTILQDFRAG